MRGQEAVEEALSLVDARGFPSREGFLLCGHLMPSKLFARPEADAGAPPGPDDDLVEGGCLEAIRKFERALGTLRGLGQWDAPS